MDTTKGFQYQLVGAKHGCMLAVSLYTLRRFHSEPIQIVCGDSAALWTAHHIVQSDLAYLDPIQVNSWEAPKEGGKGQQHANKATGVTLSPFDSTIFLDADTTIHARLDELWPTKDEVHLTRFADWCTTGGIMRGRLQAWKHIMPERVLKMHCVSYPAINTGVFSFSQHSTAYLDKWKEITDANPIFMSDELAAQLLFIDFPHVVNSDRFNYSPRYSIPNDEQIRVIHYHGFQHTRPEKSNGWKTWTGLYRTCYSDNLCGVREIVKDKHLSSWLVDNPRFLETGHYGRTP